MVYIHGGGFYLHSIKEYPPTYLMERDIILVVIQYRLDALGMFNVRIYFEKNTQRLTYIFQIRIFVHKLKRNSRECWFNGLSTSIEIHKGECEIFWW